MEAPAIPPGEGGPSGEVGDAAPAVVAVIVTCNPGWWLEPCLESLAHQDYPELSVLVVDADSDTDPTARIAAVMPSAFVRRVRHRNGFGAAANEVLSVVEGATHYVLCHDDVALDDRAVRLMVEEAFRSNAGLVAPKVVSWFDGERLLAAGMGVDRFGTPVRLVDRGELDQEQHDGVRDVFYAPGACTLVRADLFATLRGFDVAYGRVGDDLDLGWRAHVAGARAVVAPAAVVRHLEVTDLGQRALDGTLRDDDPDKAERVVLADMGETAPVQPIGHAGGEPDTYEPDVEAWDISRWDEDDEAPAAVVEEAAPHLSRRARREAERTSSADVWTGDDEDPWSAPRARRRFRRGPRPAREDEIAIAPEPEPEPPPLEEPVVAPMGRDRGPDAAAIEAARADARLRVVAVGYGAFRAIGTLTVMFTVAVLESALRVVLRESEAARVTMRPWGVLARSLGSVRRARAVVRSVRTVGDGGITDFQIRGLVRFRESLREPVLRDPDVPLPSWVDGRRLAWLGGLAAAALFVYGDRRLMFDPLPALGSFVPWPSLGVIGRTATSGWRATGLGTAAAAPTALLLIGLGGVVFLGHTAALQHVLVFGMVPLGLLGVVRLVRPFGSRRLSTAVLIGYLVVPLPYNAIATSDWPGLIAYAAVPWILRSLLRAAEIAPFDARAPRSLPQRILSLALIVALAGAVEPALLPLTVALAVAVAIATAVVGPRRASGRAVVVSAGAAGAALLLLFPWSMGWIPPGGEWAMFAGRASTGAAVRFPTLLRFETGPMGGGFAGYALLVVAALPLVLGRGWRFEWAARCWLVAVAFFGVAWAAQHGALGVGWPPADVLLAPAAVAVAVSIGLGVAAFDTDLAGYNFGWRQGASGIAALAAVIAVFPPVTASLNGRWHRPQTGLDSVLSWMPAKRADGDFRVLWVGRPGVLPITGWDLPGGLAYATSMDGVPDITDDWPGTSRGATRLLGQALELAEAGHANDVGRLLAPMAVRYVVVVDGADPLAQPQPSQVTPPALTDGLNSQLDLEQVERTQTLSVYQNDAWAPIVSQITPAIAQAGAFDDPRVAGTVNLAATATGLVPAFTAPSTFKGTVPAPSNIELAEAPSGHWQLRAGGHSAPRSNAFGEASVFDVSTGGSATIRYNTPFGWRLALLVEVAMWLAAIFVVFRREPEVMPQPDPPGLERAGERLLVGT